MLLRRLILIVVLLLAQFGASVHALEHFGAKADEHIPGQTCSMCLAAHDLTTVLASSEVPLPHPIARFFWLDACQISLCDPLAPQPNQRGPPTT